MKPDLDRSIAIIKSLKRDTVQQSSTKVVAEVYVAAIGLLYLLKIDQQALQRIRDDAEQEKKTPKCPPPNEIPAISAVLQDVELFTTLVQCLSTTVSVPSLDGETSTPATGSRKRALSFNNSDASKFLKTSHSPNPAGRKLVDPVVAPHYPVATLAATILYSSLAHVDHWPPSLTKAYADDIFGPRLWIDEPNCRLLVQNLELCHQSSASVKEATQASLVAEADKDQLASPPSIEMRQGTLSSTGSFQEQRKRKRNSSGNSSSSGEDDEEMLLTTQGRGKAIARRKKTGDPVNEENLDLEPVRHRYHGTNLEAARDRIASSLQERLDVKSKQNSGLLQALPLFVSIPRIRSLIASNLSKWLQSPALAGLARTLFSATVHHMKHEDPPLPDDLLAIDSILAMRLKANQLNAHIGNVTAIAKRIPTQTVVHHMYSKLLCNELEPDSILLHGVSESSNGLKMIGAIHAAVPAQMSYDAVASAFLTMMRAHQLEPITESHTSESNRNRLIFQLRRFLRMFSVEISSSFDGIQLIKSFFQFDVGSQVWTPRDEEDRARLMFQCVTLAVSPFVRVKGKCGLSNHDQLKLRESLLTVRTLVLSWFCTNYGPRFSVKLRKRIDAKRRKESVGAGLPDFRSIFSPSEEETIPSWLNTIRCLLFIEDPESELMREFALPVGAASPSEYAKEWETEGEAVRLCCEHGVDTTGELLWIILKASKEGGGGLEPEMSIELIENLLESCTKTRKGKVKVEDPTLVWELYNLAQYTPLKEVSSSEVPRLAYPGIWWRATIVSLVLCGASGKIANVMWNEHPTLRSIMKMVTSSRYRFPTVDCNDAGRDEMKANEQRSRDKESRIVELLFLPTKPVEDELSKKSGFRMSKRLLQQQKEKDETRLLEEKNLRKKILKAAQKTIMLWGPDGPARKPPKEIADAIVVVDNAFELSGEFQRSVDPDFLSMTIGTATREAVERAYDWLIPIVSKFPDTITRLHSSTSCFLLLRAYGTDGGGEKKQLWELAAPLLRHVQDSLEGKFGPGESLKAFELLMSDVASQNPDRRRCARRVLQESLPVANDNSTSGAWMVAVLQLRNAAYLVPDAVKYMAAAASFERGSVLRVLVVSLQRIIEYSQKHDIEVLWRYTDLIVDLISQRPSVFAEAIDSFADLRSIIIKVVFDELSRYSDASDDSTKLPDLDQTVIELKLFRNRVNVERVVQIPLSLVQSISVFLSLWKEEFRSTEGDSSKYVDALADALLRRSFEDKEEDMDAELVCTKNGSKQGATVPVELWIMLAKARSDVIARRAALSAPATFLPRLLMCSGLPRASLLTMIDRLGRLGQRSVDMTKTYLDLLVPSASSHWDIGQVGARRQISRKLLGRLTSYMILHGISWIEDSADVSTTFLKWLSQTCSNEAKSTKRNFKKSKNLKPRLPGVFLLKTVTSELDDLLMQIQPFRPEECSEWIERNQSEHAPKRPEMSTLDQISKGIRRGDVSCVELMLHSLHDKNQSIRSEAATVLLRYMYSQEQLQDSTLSLLMKWFPILTKFEGTSELWKNVFSRSASEKVAASLVVKCVEEWTSSHTCFCVKWMCGKMSVEDDTVHIANVARFLINVIPISFGSGIQMTVALSRKRGISEIEGIIKIVRACLKNAISPCDHNALVGFDLGLWASSLGKSTFDLISNNVVLESGTSNGQALSPVFSAFLLQMYLRNPSWLDLSSERVRQLLMEASALFQEKIIEWSSSLDDRLDEVIESISTGQFRSINYLSEMAHKHPLIVLRKGTKIASILELDAMKTGKGDGDIRGVVHGQGDLSREFRFMSKDMKLTVRHWGYSYSEPVWAAFLDIIISVSKEVLFGCGFRIGLSDLLAPYLKLMSIQLQLLSREKSKMLRSKLADLFQNYQQHKLSEWRQWLGTNIEGTEVRHLLILCELITPQQAIESLKPAT